MIQEKELTLALIHLLTRPNVIIEGYSIESELVNDPNYMLTNTFCDTPIRMPTGRKFIKLTIFEYDNTDTKATTGTVKRPKNADRKRPMLDTDLIGRK